MLKKKQIVGYAAVDDDLFDELNAFKWYLNTSGYAVRKIGPKDRRIEIQMHRFVMGVGHGDKILVDHRDNNRLNNIKDNLRFVTARGNAHNCLPNENTSSKYRGVSFHKMLQKWQAYCQVDGKLYYLGVYVDEFEASEVARKFREENMDLGE